MKGPPTAPPISPPPLLPYPYHYEYAFVKGPAVVTLPSATPSSLPV